MRCNIFSASLEVSRQPQVLTLNLKNERVALSIATNISYIIALDVTFTLFYSHRPIFVF